MLAWYCVCFFLWVLDGGGALAATESTGAQRELDMTPTWAVAGVSAVMIIISIVMEKFLERVGEWLTEKHKKALFEALMKVKSELMILGFIPLLLTFGQSYIAGICLAAKILDNMLPCASNSDDSSTKCNHRRLLWYDHRFLAAGSYAPNCKAGYAPLISVNGLHQLHILIFFLAVFHVMHSVVTMMLGRLKIRGWKEWQKETSSPDYEFSNDPARFRLTHQTSIVRAHTSFWTRIPVFFYIGWFFRQFFKSVSKADYLTLLNGFIAVHLAPGSKFNFQKYIKDDFKLVVGVSAVLWGAFVVYLLLNVKGWQALFWASPVPVIVKNFDRKRIPRRGWCSLYLVLFLLFLSALIALGDVSGGEPGDGGSAGAKGSVSGGPPSGDTDVGSAPSPPKLRR